MTTNLALTHMLGATKDTDKEHRNKEAGGKEGVEKKGDKEKSEMGEDDKGKDDDSNGFDPIDGGVFCETCQVVRCYYSLNSISLMTRTTIYP